MTEAGLKDIVSVAFDNDVFTMRRDLQFPAWQPDKILVYEGSDFVATQVQVCGDYSIVPGESVEQS